MDGLGLLRRIDWNAHCEGGTVCHWSCCGADLTTLLMVFFSSCWLEVGSRNHQISWEMDGHNIFINKKSTEEEIPADIEIGNFHEPHLKPGPNPGSSSKWENKTLNKLLSGVLGSNRSHDDREPTAAKPDSISGSVEHPNEPNQRLVVPNVDKENRKAGRSKIAPPKKPPRPPRGPSLDAVDMRLIKEISKIAVQRREMMERIKALKKMKAARLPLSSSSSSSSSSPSSSSSSSSSTISAMAITVLFFLVLIFQGLSCSTSSNMRLVGGPKPAPEMRWLRRVRFYGTDLSHDDRRDSSMIQN